MPERSRAALGAVAVLLAALAASARAGEAEPGAHAVIVTGLPGSPVYARRFRDWATRFRAHLVGAAGVPGANVTVLAGDKGFHEPFVKGEATRESLLAAVSAAAAGAGPDDQLVLILIGHGVVTARPPTFVVRGRDPDAEEIADALDPARARNQVVLNLSASAGASLRYMAKRGASTSRRTPRGRGTSPSSPSSCCARSNRSARTSRARRARATATGA
ncbi:MAG: hypothetical protein ACYTKD_13170 [Planctomycetota bacterium]|jgi:hypothetical protein